MNMDTAVTVGLPHLRRVDLGQPVVGNHLAGQVQDQAPQRIALIGVGTDPPVALVQILIDRGGHIHHGLAILAQAAALLAVDRIGPQGGEMIGRYQRLLHHILDLLNAGRLLGKTVAQHLQYLAGDELGLVLAKLSGGRACPLDGGLDAECLKRDAAAVTFDDGNGCCSGLVHV